MAIITKNFTFTAGATVVAAEHNANNDTIYNEFNGNIDNANISASAAIVDTKLATISTANKVSGAAFASLSSVPAGAGEMPAANVAGGTATNALVKLVSVSTLPALTGSNLTTLNGSNIASGTVPAARLGSGTTDSTTFLRGDSTWSAISGASNTVFCWNGTATCVSTSYTTFANFKFQKVAGISNITLHIQMEGVSSATTSTCLVAISTLSATAFLYGSTLAWVSSTTLSIAGLTNLAVYNGVVQIKSVGAIFPTVGTSSAYAVTVIGS
jgi:hypothetical protein